MASVGPHKHPRCLGHQMQSPGQASSSRRRESRQAMGPTGNTVEQWENGNGASGSPPCPGASASSACLQYSGLQLALGPMLFQAEAPKRTPVATPVRPPTAQEVCYRRAQQAQRDSASWLQAAPRPAERLSSVRISAPGEKRRIAHVPNPRLAASKSWPHPFSVGPLALACEHSENLCCT